MTEIHLPDKWPWFELLAGITGLSRRQGTGIILQSKVYSLYRRLYGILVLYGGHLSGAYRRVRGCDVRAG